MRDASTTQVTANAEIQNIKQILGLQHGKVGAAGGPGRGGCAELQAAGEVQLAFSTGLRGRSVASAHARPGRLWVESARLR